MKSQDVGRCEVCIGKSVRIMRVEGTEGETERSTLSFHKWEQHLCIPSNRLWEVYHILVVVTRSTPKYSEAMLFKTFTAFLIEVPCNFFLFTLNVPSERFASQSQQPAVIISYTVCILLGHVHSHILIALTSHLKTTRSF